VLYFNGQPLRAFSALNLPAFVQTTGIVLPNGQRVSANSRGVVNIRVDMSRGAMPYGGTMGGSTFGSNYYPYGSSGGGGNYPGSTFGDVSQS